MFTSYYFKALGKAALAITLGIIFYSITEAYVVEVGKSPVDVFVGQNATLQCSYTIEPGDSDLPQIDWYKGDTVESDDSNRILSLINASNLLYPNEDKFSPAKFTATRVEIESNKTAVDLHISGVLTNDNSIYLCNVDVGSAGGIILLAVQGPSPPTFVGIGGFTPVLEGGSNNLTCWSDGVPTTTCTWKNQDKYLPTPAPDSCLLDLPNMQRSDAGTYKCIVANSEGSKSGTFKIDVEFPPLITNREDNPDKLADEGGEAVLRCEAEGNPPPDFDWTKGSTVITGSQVYVSDPDGFNRYSTLTIDSVDPEKDYGDYTCDATNPHGHDILTINLSRTTVPEPPINVGVTDATGSELTVIWTEGEDGGHPQTFTVEYKESGSGTDWKKVDGIDKPPVTLTGLQPLTVYEIRVQSQNILGKSDYSETITASTIVTNGSGNTSTSNIPVIIGVFVTIVLLIESSKHEPV